MTIKVIMPKAGMGTTEGTISKWHKTEGSTVTAGELLVEIETAKAVQEVEAPVTGILSKILLTEDETADVHEAIAEIEETAGA